MRDYIDVARYQGAIDWEQLVGKIGGAMLKTIGSKARIDIEEMLGCRVNLQLWVKVKKDWRDSDFLLKNFGYNPKDTV